MLTARGKAFVLTAFLVGLSAGAGTRLSSTPAASFAGHGPAGFRLEGKTTELTLSDDGQRITVIVPLATLKTGIALRDKHMRDKYLETDKFPNAVLEVLWAAIRLPPDGQTIEGRAAGRFTLHGQTRDAVFSYSVKRALTSYQVVGNISINLKDYGIAPPSYLGLSVQPDIQATAQFSATHD